MLNISLGDAWTMEADTLLCITAPLEMFRRWMWNYFRLENEHLNNCGQFRAVRDISVKPMRAGEDAEDLVAIMDAPDGVSHRGTPAAAAGLRKRRKKGKVAGLWRAAEGAAHQLTNTAARARKALPILAVETAPGRLLPLPSKGHPLL